MSLSRVRANSFVWFMSRVPKPLTCSVEVTAQKAISPKPCCGKERYVMPPMTVPLRLTSAVDLRA